MKKRFSYLNLLCGFSIVTATIIPILLTTEFSNKSPNTNTLNNESNNISLSSQSSLSHNNTNNLRSSDNNLNLASTKLSNPNEIISNFDFRSRTTTTWIDSASSSEVSEIKLKRANGVFPYQVLYNYKRANSSYVDDEKAKEIITDLFFNNRSQVLVMNTLPTSFNKKSFKFEKIASNPNNTFSRNDWAYDDNINGAIYIKVVLTNYLSQGNEVTGGRTYPRWIKISGFKRSVPLIDQRLYFKRTYNELFPSEWAQSYLNNNLTLTELLEKMSDDFKTSNSSFTVNSIPNPIYSNQSNTKGFDMQINYSNETGSMSFNVYFDAYFNAEGRYISNNKKFYGIFDGSNTTGEPQFKHGSNEIVKNVIDINDPYDNNSIDNPLYMLIGYNANQAKSFITGIDNYNIRQIIEDVIIKVCFRFINNGTSSTNIDKKLLNLKLNYFYVLGNQIEIKASYISTMNARPKDAIFYLVGFANSPSISKNNNYPLFEQSSDSQTMVPIEPMQAGQWLRDSFGISFSDPKIENFNKFIITDFGNVKPEDLIVDHVMWEVWDNSLIINSIAFDSVDRKTGLHSYYDFAQFNLLKYVYTFSDVNKNTTFPLQLQVSSKYASYYPFQCIPSSSQLDERNQILARMLYDFAKKDPQNVPQTFDINDIIIDNNSFIYDNKNGTITFAYKARDIYKNGAHISNYADFNCTLIGLTFPPSPTVVTRSHNYENSSTIEQQPEFVVNAINNYVSTNINDQAKLRLLVNHFFEVNFLDQELLNKITIKNFKASQPNNLNGSLRLSFDLYGYFTSNGDNLIYIDENSTPNQPLRVDYMFYFFHSTQPTTINDPIIISSSEKTNLLTHEFIQKCLPLNADSQSQSPQLSFLKNLIANNINGDFLNPDNLSMDQFITIKKIIIKDENNQDIVFDDKFDQTTNQAKKLFDYLDTTRKIRVEFTLQHSYDSAGNDQINKIFNCTIDGETEDGFNKPLPTRFKTKADDNYEIKVKDVSNTDAQSWGELQIRNFLTNKDPERPFNYKGAIKGTIPQYFDYENDLIIKDIDYTKKGKGQIFVNLSLENFFSIDPVTQKANVFYDQANGYDDTTWVILSGFETIDDTKINETTQITTIDLSEMYVGDAVDGISSDQNSDSLSNRGLISEAEWKKIILDNAISGGKKDISPNDIIDLQIRWAGWKDINHDPCVGITFTLQKQWIDGSLITNPVTKQVFLYGFKQYSPTSFKMGSTGNEINNSIEISKNNANISAQEFFNSISNWKDYLASVVNIQQSPSYYYDQNDNWTYKTLNKNDNLLVGLQKLPTDQTDQQGYYIDDQNGRLIFKNISLKYFYNIEDGLLVYQNEYNKIATYDYPNIPKTICQDNKLSLKSEMFPKLDVVFSGFKPISNTQIYDDNKEYDISIDPSSIVYQYRQKGIHWLVSKLSTAINQPQKDAQADTILANFIQYLYGNIFLPNTNKDQILASDIQMILPSDQNELSKHVIKMQGKFWFTLKLNKYWLNGQLKSVDKGDEPLTRKYYISGIEIPSQTQVIDNAIIDVSSYNWANNKDTSAQQILDLINSPSNSEIKTLIFQNLQFDIFNECIKGYKNSLSSKDIVIKDAYEPSNVDGTLKIHFQVNNMWIEQNGDISQKPISPQSQIFSVTLVGINQIKVTTVVENIDLNECIEDKQSNIKFNVKNTTAFEFSQKPDIKQIIIKLFDNNPQLISGASSYFKAAKDIIVDSVTCQPNDTQIQVELTFNNCFNQNGVLGSQKFKVNLIGFRDQTNSNTKMVSINHKDLNGDLLNYVVENNVTSARFATELKNNNIGSVNLFKKFLFENFVDLNSNISGINFENICFVVESLQPNVPDCNLRVSIYLNKFFYFDNQADQSQNGLFDNVNKPQSEQIELAKKYKLYKNVTINGFSQPVSNNGITTKIDKKEFDIRDFDGSGVCQGSSTPWPIFKDILPSQVDNTEEYKNYLKIWALHNLYSGNLDDIVTNHYIDWQQVADFRITTDDKNGVIIINQISLKNYWDYKDHNDPNSPIILKHNGLILTEIRIKGFKKALNTTINSSNQYNLQEIKYNQWMDDSNIPSDWKTKFTNFKKEYIDAKSNAEFIQSLEDNKLSIETWKIYIYKWIANYYANNYQVNPENNIFTNLPSDVHNLLISFANDWSFLENIDQPNNLFNKLNQIIVISPLIPSMGSESSEIQISVTINKRLVDGVIATDRPISGSLTFSGLKNQSKPTEVLNEQVFTINEKNDPAEHVIDDKVVEPWQNELPLNVIKGNQLPIFEGVIKDAIIRKLIIGRTDPNIKSPSNISIDSISAVDILGKCYVSFHLNEYYVANEPEAIDGSNQKYSLTVIGFMKGSSQGSTNLILPIILGSIGGAVFLILLVIILWIFVKRRRDIEYQK